MLSLGCYVSAGSCTVGGVSVIKKTFVTTGTEMGLKFVTASLSPPFGTGATGADFLSCGVSPFFKLVLKKEVRLNAAILRSLTLMPSCPACLVWIQAP